METNHDTNERRPARPIVILASALLMLLGLIFSSNPASAQIGDLQVCTQDCGVDPEPTVPPALPPIIAVPVAPTPIPTLPPVFVPPPTPVPVPTLPPVLIDPPAPEPNLSAVIFHSCDAAGVVVAYKNTGGAAGGFGITVAHEGKIPFIADLLVPANTEATFLVELDEGATVTVSALDQGVTVTADCEPDEIDEEVPEPGRETPDDADPDPVDPGTVDPGTVDPGTVDPGTVDPGTDETPQDDGTDTPVPAEPTGGDDAEDSDAGNTDAGEPDAEEPDAEETESVFDEFDAKEDGRGDPVIMGDESAAAPVDTATGTDPIVLTLIGLAGALLMAIVVLLIVLIGRRRDPAS